MNVNRVYAVTKITNPTESFKTIHEGLQLDQQALIEHFDFCDVISFRNYDGVRTVVVGISTSFIYFKELDNY